MLARVGRTRLGVRAGKSSARKCAIESTVVRKTRSGAAQKSAIENAGIRQTRDGAARMRERANADTRETGSGAAGKSAGENVGVRETRSTPVRMRNGSRRTQRQVATTRIWTIAVCGEVNLWRGSQPMSRGAQCEVDSGVNKISRVANRRGYGTRSNAQTLVPVSKSGKANGANNSIRPKA